MEKPANADYPLNSLIKQRWSPRVFGEQSVAPDDVRSLFEAARWAPSCFNEQPWIFFAARKEDEQAFAKMKSCMVEFNQNWAGAAPLLMLGCIRKTFSRNGKLNDLAAHDLGLAVANMTIQAESMGMVVHQMAGILHDRIREVYALPEDGQPYTAIAVGYPGTLDGLEPEIVEREMAPRERRKQAEFVFSDSWGNAY